MIKRIDNLSFKQIDTQTRFEEQITRNNLWITWGVDNMFVEFLYSLIDFSPIHNACIRSKVDNCVGNGFTQDYKINSKESLNDIIKQAFFDYIVTGNLFFEIIWKNQRSEGIAGLHFIPSKFIRLHKPEDDEIGVTKYLYCRDWKSPKKTPIIEFHEFNPNDFENRQIIHIKDFQPGYDYYGAPSYLSAINDIRLNREITIFNLANLINGASPSLWIHFPSGYPDSETEQDDILRRIEDRYQGSNNSGKVVVSFSDDASGKPDITQISSNLQQGFYSEVFELVQHQVLAAHKVVDPSLIGLPSRTGFSSSAEQLETAYKLFMKTSIIPVQEFIIRELEPLVQLMYPNEVINLQIENPTLY